MSVLASTTNVRNRFTCAFTIAFFLGDALVSPSRRTQPDAIKAAAIASTALWIVVLQKKEKRMRAGKGRGKNVKEATIRRRLMKIRSDGRRQ
jgi:hypothetical protein